MNSLATIIISLILLVPSIPQSYGDDQVKVLSYNPTYEIWFFLPDGRPKWVSPNVEKAYFEARGNGGVCYKDDWYYCKTGEKIKE
ncbi:uncharacterized protein Dana_GF17629 [Drosophila ananassae]|uniref:Uncharacterized protein n=1 Tax=Drosophila ananassae TaxID=7217 RepID=B3LXU3_DROAN|nr:uncharacterized protein LOC6500413 [Drosophila ananassae]EDV41750.1 uncharacterized protein Dana_GF17629 [Drosophila ananassae]